MKRIKKSFAFILAVIMTVSALPFTAYAKDAPVISVAYCSDDYAELEWSINNPDNYSKAEIQTKDNQGNWTTESTPYLSSTLTVDLKPKTVSYFRVRLYSNSDGYTDWSNEVVAYPDLTEAFDFESNSYTYASASLATLYWKVSKFNLKYFDGFNVYASVNGSGYKLIKSIPANSYFASDTYSYEYKASIKPPSTVGYSIEFKLYHYFEYDSKTYQSSGQTVENARYLSNSYAKVTTKNNKVILNFANVGASRVKIQYNSYSLKGGSSSSTRTVYATGSSYSISNSAKYYGLELSVTPCWGSIEGDTIYLSSHDPLVLLRSAPRSKKKKIKVIGTRGKKAKVHWKETLTKKDKKIIKKFFYKKFKGKNPPREEMALYAFNWIHSKVKYDYKYKTGNLSYTNAIFNKKKGQCLQYNGAMAKVLTYLGYEARIIEGKRRSTLNGQLINHYWCEVKLNGRWYLVETGNEKKSGSWQHFVELYGDGQGYIKCKKPAKDA